VEAGTLAGVRRHGLCELEDADEGSCWNELLLGGSDYGGAHACVAHFTVALPSAAGHLRGCSIGVKRGNGVTISAKS
jgi:hypothetical protein